MKVAVVILNYNSNKDCKRCIEFLRHQKGVEIELIVVDNASKTDDVENLRKMCYTEKCTFIENKENRGYNAGNNIGLRYAAEKGYRYALIANPDMEFPDNDYLVRLVEVMELDSEVVVVGSNIINAEGYRQSPKKFTSYWEELNWLWNGLKNRVTNHSKIMPPKNQYCDILMGCCIMVKLDFIKKIGFFDENVFLYNEESILGKQVQHSGKKMYYLHDITAIHRHIKSMKSSQVNRMSYYWKSRKYYLKRYGGYNRLALYTIYLTRGLYYFIKMKSLKLREKYIIK